MNLLVVFCTGIVVEGCVGRCGVPLHDPLFRSYVLCPTCHFWGRCSDDSCCPIAYSSRDAGRCSDGW